MTEATARVTDGDQAAADQAVEAARTADEAVKGEQARLHSEREALQERALAAIRERADLQARRTALLPRLQDATEAAGAEIELGILNSKMAAADQRAANFRDAAALLDPQIAVLLPVRARAQRELLLAEYRRPWLTHRRDAEQLHEALEAIDPRVGAFLASGAALEAAHRAAWGRPSRLDDPYARLARTLSVWATGLLSVQYRDFMLRRWPPETASLTAPLDTVAPDRYATQPAGADVRVERAPGEQTA